MSEELENRNMCGECGGYCCKKCGCDYFVSDFTDISIDSIEKVLQEGRTSIVATLIFGEAKNGKTTVEPILSLRARNKGREEIDLFSFKTTCASLEDDGCHYDFEHRPSAGTMLVPFFHNGERNCYSIADGEEELEKWIPYQKKLREIVKRHTGLSVYAKLKEDVENVFSDILVQKFNGVAREEVYAVLRMLPILVEVYPDEYKKAKEKVKKSPLVKTIFK